MHLEKKENQYGLANKTKIMAQKKLILSAALTGAATNRSHCPYIPFTPKELGEEAKRKKTDRQGIERRPTVETGVKVRVPLEGRARHSLGYACFGQWC